MITEIIRKTFRPEIKGVDTEDGTIDMLIPMSTASIDRDGESIDPLGWKKSLPAFRKRPVLLSSHDYGDLRKQIGEFKSIKLSEDGLMAKPKYYINEGNEEADWAFKLASKGMAAYSVGFIPTKWEDGDGDKTPRRTYTEQELLEISHVVVPSNRDAIQGLRGKSADPMINQLVEDIVNAEIVDLTEEKETVTKPEETDNFIHIPAPGEEGKHEGHRIRTITLSDKEGISAKYCGECKKNISYMFDKDKGWDMAKAKQWVKDHEKSVNSFITHWLDTCKLELNNAAFNLLEEALQTQLLEHPKAKDYSQKEIEDEIEFTRLLISENGMSDATKSMAWELVREIMRLTGNDMPDDIREKFTLKIDSGAELVNLVKEIFHKQEVK